MVSISSPQLDYNEVGDYTTFFFSLCIDPTGVTILGILYPVASSWLLENKSQSAAEAFKGPQSQKGMLQIEMRMNAIDKKPFRKSCWPAGLPIADLAPSHQRTLTLWIALSM